MEEVESFNHVLKDAKSGSALSQYWVAERYFDGKGTQIDRKEAIYWFRKSAKKGYMKSILLLGSMFTQVKSNKEIELLGVKYLQDLAYYDKTFPNLYKKDSQYQFQKRETAFLKLIKFYREGGHFLNADKKQVKKYLLEYQSFKQRYKFFDALNKVNLFYQKEVEDKKIQNDFIESIRYGADVNATYEKSKGVRYSLLFYSIIKNNKELFELLLSKGADIDYRSEDGKNAFYIAIFHRNLDFAKKLYDKGIKLDLDTRRYNPLTIAALDKNREMMEYLVYIGYKPKERVTAYNDLLAFMLDTPYIQADVFNYSKDMISASFIEWVVKKYGFDVNGTASRKNIPYLCIALVSGSENIDDTVEMLLKKGANPNAKAQGFYPLNCVNMKAPMKRKITLLLQYGADKNLKNRLGNTAEEFYLIEIENNDKKIKEYSTSENNKVRIKQTENRNIQEIIDNAFGGRKYVYRDEIYKKYNEHLREALELLR